MGINLGSKFRYNYRQSRGKRNNLAKREQPIILQKQRRFKQKVSSPTILPQNVPFVEPSLTQTVLEKLEKDP